MNGLEEQLVAMNPLVGRLLKREEFVSSEIRS